MVEVVCRTAIVGGHYLFYQEVGLVDGPVVVLIHGLVLDSDIWDWVIELFVVCGLWVIVVDLLGHGYLDKPWS